MRNKPKIRAQESGGNIFADLGLRNPEQELPKAQLTLQIYKIIKQRGLTQAQAGELLGIKQPHVSALMRNRAGNFLHRPLNRVSHCARAGRPDHGEADSQRARGDVGRCAVVWHAQTSNALVVERSSDSLPKTSDPLDIVANGLESPGKTERDNGQVPGAWARLARA